MVVIVFTLISLFSWGGSLYLMESGRSNWRPSVPFMWLMISVSVLIITGCLTGYFDTFDLLIGFAFIAVAAMQVRILRHARARAKKLGSIT